MPKIARKLLAHFINVDETGESPAYERLGSDLEEFSPEMSAEVESTKNILGETSIKISSYSKTASVEPYYADSGTKLYERLQKIIDNDLVLDDLKADVVDVKLWEEASPASTYPAVKEEVMIEVVSYGGDTTGYQIPFNLHYTGVKTQGTFNISTKTFTPGGAG